MSSKSRKNGKRRLFYRTSPAHALRLPGIAEGYASITASSSAPRQRCIFTNRQAKRHPQFPGWKEMLKTQIILTQRWIRGDCQIKYLPQHNGSVYYLQFDAKRIITGARDKSLRMWYPSNGKSFLPIFGAHQASVLCMRYDDDILVSGGVMLSSRCGLRLVFILFARSMPTALVF